MDTRSKIELGDLVIKSKLGYLHKDNKDVILGILIDAFNKLNTDEGHSHFNYYKQLGIDAFSKK